MSQIYIEGVESPPVIVHVVEVTQLTPTNVEVDTIIAVTLNFIYSFHGDKLKTKQDITSV